jgi:cysteinyl-tRNA synthetase
MPLRLYNTLTKRLEDFAPRDPSNISFYSCGPTVYDDAHIGNFRSFLGADLLRRWIESPLCEIGTKEGTQKGPRRVTHVMNITDVGHMTDDDNADGGGEDKMEAAAKRIEAQKAEAKKSGKSHTTADLDPSDPYQIARFYESRFREDAKKLGLKLALEAEKDPTLMPRATESVQGMIALIARLIEKGNAYVVGESGSRVVYFRVKSFPDYGRLSGNTLDRLKEGEGGRINAEHQGQKEHPADFLLWKEDSRHKMKWDSPWGSGYPGWHIECSVMSAARLCANASDRASRVSERSHDAPVSASDLGLTPEALQALTIPDAAPIIDLHSGGEDNIFPHHECELAQSCSAFNQSAAGATYAAMWFHARFLMVEGTKMSKSKGNFFTARDLFAKGIEPAALRLELIKTHYRSNANFTMQGLTDSQRMIDRWRRVADAHKPAPARDAEAEEAWRRSLGSAPVLRDFAQSLHDDLNIAGAIAAVNSWVGSITTPTPDDAAIMRLLDNVLGVLTLERPQAAQSDIGIFLPGTTPDPVVIAKLEDRRAARAAKDFKKSDQIRDELLALGYAIKDVAGGKVEVSRAK